MTNTDATTKNTGILRGGDAEYDLAEAAVSIDELIETLQNMKDNGLENVVLSSGNYRGAKWASLKADWSWADDED